MRTPMKASQGKTTHVVDHTDHQDEQTKTFRYVRPEVENGQAILKYFRPQSAQKEDPGDKNVPGAKEAEDAATSSTQSDTALPKIQIDIPHEQEKSTTLPDDMQTPNPSEGKIGRGIIGVLVLLLAIMIMALMVFFFWTQLVTLVLSFTPSSTESATPTPDKSVTQTANAPQVAAAPTDTLAPKITSTNALAITPTGAPTPPLPTSTVPAPTVVPTLVPTANSERAFPINSVAYIIAPAGVRLRGESNQASAEIALLSTGTQVTVLDGPASSDGLTWWKVKVVEAEQEGWVADGDATNAWLSSATPIPSP